MEDCMDIYKIEEGRYKMIQETNTISIDVPEVLSLVSFVLDDAYGNLGLNIDEFIDKRQEEFDKESAKYEKLCEEQIIQAFNLGMKVFINEKCPIYRGPSCNRTKNDHRNNQIKDKNTVISTFLSFSLKKMGYFFISNRTKSDHRN